MMEMWTIILIIAEAPTVSRTSPSKKDRQNHQPIASFSGPLRCCPEAVMHRTVTHFCQAAGEAETDGRAKSPNTHVSRQSRSLNAWEYHPVQAAKVQFSEAVVCCFIPRFLHKPQLQVAG